MQHLAIVVSQFDQSLILQYKQCVIKKELSLIMIEIIMLVNTGYLVTISVLNKIKSFTCVQLTDKAYTWHFIEFHSIKNLWINIMSQKQSVHF